MHGSRGSRGTHARQQRQQGQHARQHINYSNALAAEAAGLARTHSRIRAAGQAQRSDSDAPSTATGKQASKGILQQCHSYVTTCVNTYAYERGRVRARALQQCGASKWKQFHPHGSTTWRCTQDSYAQLQTDVRKGALVRCWYGEQSAQGGCHTRG